MPLTDKANCTRLLHLFLSFSSSVEDVTVHLPLVVPVLVARLGTPEVTEPSEELRLMYMTYISSLVDICATAMAPYLNDLVTILQRTLVDPYPEVKKVKMCTLNRHEGI